MINAKYFSTLPEIKRIRITNINGKNKKNNNNIHKTNMNLIELICLFYWFPAMIFKIIIFNES